MGQLRFLVLLTLCVAWAPMAIVIALEFLVVALGATDEGLGDYFALLLVLLMAAGAYLFVRFIDRPSARPR